MHSLDMDGQTCAHCGQALRPDRMRTGMVPDSSAVHPSDPGQDGWRLVRACGLDHLDTLSYQGRASWVEEQLWFGKLLRASRQSDGPNISLAALAERASISAGRLHQALRWNASQADPVRLLPDGQTLPPVDTPLPLDRAPKQHWTWALLRPRQ